MDATSLALRLTREPAVGIDDAVPVRSAPDAGAVNRFNDYMTAQPQDADAVTAAQPVAAKDAANPVGRTPGDGILNSLNSLGSDLSRSWQSATQAIKGDQIPTTQDMLRVQIELIGMSMTHEMVNKCITRSTQNLDQLVKLQ